MPKKESIEKLKTLSAEEYEKYLGVELVDIKKEDFNILRKVFNLIVLPSMKIVISDNSHSDLAHKYGVDFDKTLTEGTIERMEDNRIVFAFKIPGYQSDPELRKTGDDYLNFKEAIRRKVLEFIQQ